MSLLMVAPPLNARIRTARKRAKLTQDRLAEVLGISGAAVGQWENGSTRPEQDRLPEVAKVLNVSLLWLAWGIGLPEQVENPKVASHIRQIEGRSVPNLTPAGAARDHIAASQTATTRTHVHFPCSADAFQITAWDRSCFPAIHPGDSLIIDPSLPAAPENVVFAAIGVNAEPMLGRLRFERAEVGMLKIITPMNDAWPEHVMDVKTDRIVGVMTEHAAPGIRR